ncbi:MULTISPECIES: TIGR04282 family arsenosugar biosynthesis glycosyltransferase [Gordonibacter]|uniref:DUF2064 domain-containing protein n=1 Tax=Gordonibacter faecis TaxID=3047475 RepID=A0ABT7DTR9_9ACTN|nr:MULTISPECIES: DUF2064 domain-containing protein [unclassified Gordonibacter]MDJ1651515.1 DUF2064 domain-containing protein [Gordonibacter sp. KGMB12511]HIW75596.1 DUF2064 domain-containing protein [Candidatus Gordonibacter avicola]
MRERKNVLLLFSKPPVPGLVKTRLTTLKDGVFTPEVASALYHCMLFDVTEICCAALADLEARAEAAVAAGADVRDVYELIISTTPASNVDVMRRLFEESGTWPREIVFIADEGASFDEHYNHAFDQAFERGADAVLSMGADMPALTKADIFAGFDALHRLDNVEGGGIVLAPDQEMGVSVIGWTRATDFSHTGVFYNAEGLTVLPAYIAKARERDLPALYLPPIPDVDTMADLMHAITVVEALNYCARHDDITPPWRTADALAQMGWSEVRVPPNDLHDPREDIDR